MSREASSAENKVGSSELTDDGNVEGTPLPGTITFLGAPMHPWTMSETIERIEARILENRFTQHVVVNVAKLVNMQDDEELRSAVTGCHIINIDGAGVVWGARALGHEVPERVAGIDLFVELLGLAVQRGHGVYFLGADEQVIEETVRVARSQNPGLQVAGWHHGYYWREEGGEARVVDAIRKSGASMLFVGMSSPRKENFIAEHQENLGIPFVMGVGGSFDVLAGRVRRAPRWMQRAGLEWFYRLVQEPRRMWRRYLTTNSRYGLLLLSSKARGTGVSAGRGRE